MIWPMEFAPQRCTKCKTYATLTALDPIHIEGKLAGWIHPDCGGTKSV